MNNILDYLEKTAALYGEKPAVDDGCVTYTWQALVNLAKRLGAVFAGCSEARKPIALMMEKSSDTLAAMFGAVYAGCFYVIVDPTHPAERIKGIFSVLEPEYVVTYDEYLPILSDVGYEGKVSLLNEVKDKAQELSVLDDIRKQSKDTDLLYGIFTSGSTGVPKGIVVSHRAVIDFITHFTEPFGICEADILGNQAPFDFDVSVKDIYSCVMTGAKLVLIPKKLFSTPPTLLDYICDKHVNTLIWAVSALTLISALKGLKYRVPSEVKRIMFSGEVMPVKQLKLWMTALPETRFVNLYGPTEITCNCTYYPVERIFEDGEKLPLGKAFDGRQVFLLDDEKHLVTEVGVSGEICVAGESISSGYYHNPKETDAKFIHVMLDGQSTYCYCTGDLGYYDEAGALYFSGRKDFQIKHMGHRIELEEIECALNAIEGVEKSCCLMHEKRNQLVAYYYGEASSEDIRTELKKRVPVFMVPQKLIQTQEMPLTKNGKIDRKYFKLLLEGNKR